MSQRKVSFAHGEFYHIYNRGNSKQTIFRDDGDYLRFQQMMFVMNSTLGITFRFIEKDKIYQFNTEEKLVAIGTYCLMPNHFHILLTPLKENGVQHFMQKLTTGYSMYFNKKHERTGSLFEGRFKSQHVSGDEYLKYLFAYIHLNPLKLIQSDWKDVGLRNIPNGESYLGNYKFSSYIDFLRKREEEMILDREYFPEYFPSRDIFTKEIQDWMSYKPL